MRAPAQECLHEHGDPGPGGRAAPAARGAGLRRVGVFTVPAGGGPPALLSAPADFATEIAWSPDGDQLALLDRPNPELDSSSATAVYLVGVDSPRPGRSPTPTVSGGRKGAGVNSSPAMSMTSDVPTFTGHVAGGSPWSADPGRSVLDSPITHADRVVTLLLMIHGKEDVRVPLSQSTGFHRAVLERATDDRDLPVALVVYPREPHSIGESRHQQHLVRRVLEWYTTHLSVDASS